jgi:hypothetical protein
MCYTDCHLAQCHSAVCHYTECRGATETEWHSSLEVSDRLMAKICKLDIYTIYQIRRHFDF